MAFRFAVDIKYYCEGVYGFRLQNMSIRKMLFCRDVKARLGKLSAGCLGFDFLSAKLRGQEISIPYANFARNFFSYYYVICLYNRQVLVGSLVGWY
jgi:hypothetical protein